MSPEQAKSAKNVDARSDVFSLSLSLHEALSGMKPWQGRSSMGEIILAICTEDPPPLEKVAPWLEPQLVQAISRGLARDVGARFQTVQDLANALRPFALDRPVRMTDLTSLPVDRRVPSKRSLESSPSLPGAAGQAVSVTASGFRDEPAKPARSGARFAIVGGVVLVGIVSAGAFVVRGRLDRTTRQSPPPATSFPGAPADAPTATIKPIVEDAAGTTAIPSGDAGVAATDAGHTSSTPQAAGSLPKPPLRPSAIPSSASATSASPSAASSKPFGRGLTAPDLPP